MIHICIHSREKSFLFPNHFLFNILNFSRSTIYHYREKIKQFPADDLHMRDLRQAVQPQRRLRKTHDKAPKNLREAYRADTYGEAQGT